MMQQNYSFEMRRKLDADWQPVVVVIIVIIPGNDNYMPALSFLFLC
jgi:hypothetical protein